MNATAHSKGEIHTWGADGDVTVLSVDLIDFYTPQEKPELIAPVHLKE